MPLLRTLLSPPLHALLRGVEWVGEITPGTRRAAGFGTFGASSCIGFPQATVLGERSIHIGTETLIGRHVTLTVGYGVGDTNVPERGLVIGDRCVIGARCTLTAHESIELGDDVWFGQDVFVSDASHGYQDPAVPIGQQLGMHQPVAIGSGSWIGHGAMVLPGTVIGRNVVVGAGSVVRGEIPDHAVVAGIPARVVRHLEPGLGWVGARDGDVRPIRDSGDLELLVQEHEAAEAARRSGSELDTA
ncbi:acyltransferase [Nocardioides alcanivorans]|uniref:acyltransferase n=1 Tax=Nocardioides alcanivorans TaxID=2897352 RepID=UPI001F2CB5F7|nr:acyltransferase [Nocardioides alcanivorans]